MKTAITVTRPESYWYFFAIVRNFLNIFFSAPRNLSTLQKDLVNQKPHLPDVY